MLAELLVLEPKRPQKSSDPRNCCASNRKRKEMEGRNYWDTAVSLRSLAHHKPSDIDASAPMIGSIEGAQSVKG